MAGVTDCITKCFGTTNRKNVVKAVLDGLSRQREKIKAVRGVELGATVIEDEDQARRASSCPSPPAQNKAKGPINTISDDRKRGRGGPRRRGSPGGGGGGGGGEGGGGGWPATPRRRSTARDRSQGLIQPEHVF